MECISETLPFLKLQYTSSSPYLPFVRLRKRKIMTFFAAGMASGFQKSSGLWVEPPAPPLAVEPPVPGIPPAFEPPELEEPPVPRPPTPCPPLPLAPPVADRPPAETPPELAVAPPLAGRPPLPVAPPLPGALEPASS